MSEALPTDTKYKAVFFIETYTGRKFDPLNPKPGAISVLDIAHALSNQCRYSGHTRRHYSVAQHSCLLADYTQHVLKRPALECLQILMHDAPEAYLVDVPRPVKQFMPEFRQWDKNVNDAIRIWLGVTDLPIPEYQDEIDSRIISDERAQLMSDSGNDWGHDREPLGVEIAAWTPEYAEKQFLLRYAVYAHAVYGVHQYWRDGWGLPFKVWHAEHGDTSGVTGGELTSCFEVDVRGGVGKLYMRTPDGMLIRDREAGAYPEAKWKFLHGQFELFDPKPKSKGELHVAQPAG